MCASANFMSWSTDYGKKFVSLDSLFENPQGMCTEYAEMGTHFATVLGLDAHYVSKIPLHSFVAFKLGRGEGRTETWYYAEPQEDSCNLFYLK